MGLHIMSTGDSPSPPAPGNPDPRRFTVEAAYRSGNAIAVRIYYPDCRNYEGRKVLVCDDAAAFDAAVANGSVDPHFTLRGESPFARLRPDDAGWRLACVIVDGLAGGAACSK